MKKHAGYKLLKYLLFESADLPGVLELISIIKESDDIVEIISIRGGFDKKYFEDFYPYNSCRIVGLFFLNFDILTECLGTGKINDKVLLKKWNYIIKLNVDTSGLNGAKDEISVAEVTVRWSGSLENFLYICETTG